MLSTITINMPSGAIACRCVPLRGGSMGLRGVPAPLVRFRYGLSSYRLMMLAQVGGYLFR